MSKRDRANAAAPLRIKPPPSLAALAAQSLTDIILSGDYLPGDRLVEERLCEQLGISRPPLREALKSLEYAGLVVQIPRRGAIVTPLTQHDVFEIVTMREDLEHMAMDLALPNLNNDRLLRCYSALAAMDDVVSSDNERAMTRAGFEFHISVVRLAGHHRLESAYRAMALQLELCMAMNNRARRRLEDLVGHVDRHRALLAVIERGDRAEIDQALDDHGSDTFLVEVVDQLDGATAESDRWLEGLREHARHEHTA
jgi:DNA-binding GntR family transcriptional regulator